MNEIPNIPNEDLNPYTLSESEQPLGKLPECVIVCVTIPTSKLEYVCV